MLVQKGQNGSNEFKSVQEHSTKRKKIPELSIRFKEVKDGSKRLVKDSSSLD